MESIRRRLAALSMAALTAFAVPTAAFADDGMGLKGDVTGDGKVTAADSLNVLRHVCNIEKLTDDKITNADFSEDGKVTSMDALLIQRYVLGINGNIGADPKPIDTSSEVDTGTTVEPQKPVVTDNPPAPPVYVDPNTADDPDIPDNSGYSNGYGDDAYEDENIYVSGTKYSVPVGMTLYIDGEYGIDWGSTNTDIATVDENGLVLGRRAGNVKIIALEGDSKRTIELTVTPSEAVRTVYASPNSAVLGDTVKLIATTDQTRTGVKFDVDINGTTQTVYASEMNEDDEHGIYTWIGYINADTSGIFDVQAYSQKNGEWSTCDNGESTMFVSTSSSPEETTYDTLRASDELIELISRYEGGLEEAEYDPIAYGNVMNYGYGVVIYGGDTFYNRASMSEYFADLVHQVNEKIYSRYVNQFLQENGIKYNQYQFDSLVCFVYNLGVYSLQNSGLKSILLDCYEPSADQSGEDENVAYVTSDDGLYLRTGGGINYSVVKLMDYREKVTILDDTKVNGTWVKAMTEDGQVGYCSSNYLRMAGSDSGVRNLDYVDEDDLVEEILAYHHAGGQCYWGLLYRRIDEMELFFHGDYVQDGSQNKYGYPRPWCIG
jgi:GH24 family phage-related lysozyme (muramidase)